MRIRVRQYLSVMAAFAFALHGLLLGLAPLAAVAAASDPFSVICHSIPQTPGDDAQSPTDPGGAPHGCEHCNLCATADVPTLDGIFAGQLVPARLLDVLYPFSIAATISLATTPKLAQGPPASA
jgi:hypothetical protein